MSPSGPAPPEAPWPWGGRPLPAAGALREPERPRRKEAKSCKRNRFKLFEITPTLKFKKKRVECDAVEKHENDTIGMLKAR